MAFGLPGLRTIMMHTNYDDLWKTKWGDMQQFGPVHRHLRESLVRLVRSLDIRTVLDVGCGSGENLRALAALGSYELAGVDISEEALLQARQLVPGARFVRLDVQREVLPETFDLVTSIQVIEHLLADTEAIRGMARMARSHVFISTIQGRMRSSEKEIGHVRNYSVSELVQKVEAAGLKTLRVWGWGFPFYSPLYRTFSEWWPGGPPAGAVGPAKQFAAVCLYQLYRLNWPGRGDVLNILASKAS